VRWYFRQVTACLRCGVEVTVGTLCQEHVSAVATCDDITAEQILSAPVADPAAWLIDQWGCTHPLSVPATIGRSATDCTLGILHPSISALHAQLDRNERGWVIVDRGSLNGTFVGDQRIRDASLFGGERVKFGDVSFWFSLSAVPAVREPARTGRTVPSRNKDVAFCATLEQHGRRLELAQRVAGGVGRVDGDSSIEFARLEFGLLAALAQKRMMNSDLELAFVSSRELADALDFKSREADTENVRELVRRVRKKLKAQGIDDLIESRQGVGYRVSWSVVWDR